MSIFNNDWDLLLKFIDNEGNPPFHIEGDLYLINKNITTLGSLVSVGGNLDLHDNNELESLGGLVSVGGNLVLSLCVSFKSLGSVESVRGYVDVRYTKIYSLGNLKFIGGSLFLRDTPNLKMSLQQIMDQIKIDGYIDEE